MINFLYANRNDVANILDNDMVKLLLPEVVRNVTGIHEITGTYDALKGRIRTEDGEYDMYELVALWNRNVVFNDKGDGRGPAPMTYGKPLGMFLKEDRWLKMVDRDTEINRRYGIEIGCSNAETDRLIYPLKITTADYQGRYETTPFPSYADPYHGFTPAKWEDVVNCFTFKCSDDYKDYFVPGYKKAV